VRGTERHAVAGREARIIRDLHLDSARVQSYSTSHRRTVRRNWPPPTPLPDALSRQVGPADRSSVPPQSATSSNTCPSPVDRLCRQLGPPWRGRSERPRPTHCCPSTGVGCGHSLFEGFSNLGQYHPASFHLCNLSAWRFGLPLRRRVHDLRHCRAANRLSLHIRLPSRENQ
jgi:hypothetical protein